MTIRPLDTVECDASSVTDELSYMDDPWDSSECSSIEHSGEEEVDASEKIAELVHDSEDLDKKYLSAIEISSDTSFDITLKKPSLGEIPVTIGSGSHKLSEQADLHGYSLHPQHSWMNMNSIPLEFDSNSSCIMEAQSPNGKFDGGWPLNPIAKTSNCNGIGNIDDTWSNASSYKGKCDLSSGVEEKTASYCGDVISNCSDLDKEDANKRQHLSGDALNLRSLNSWEVECSNLILGTSKLRERCAKVSLPSFDFKSVRDPFTECVDRLGKSDRGDQFLVSANSAATKRYSHNKDQDGDALTVEKNSFRTHAPLDLKTHPQEQALLSNVSGGGCWESLLDCTGNKNDIRPSKHKTSAAAVIEIPLDFVLEKCLLEELQLQYP